MKYLATLLFFILLLFGEAYSQNPGRQYVSIAIGPSFPMGDFKNKTLQDSTSGWAKTGVAVQVTYVYRFTHNFGIVGEINYSSNALDIAAYKSELESAHVDTTFSVESRSNWASGGIFAGPYLRFPLTEKLSWDIRAMVGVFGATSPQITLRGTDAGGESLDDYFLQTATAIGFAYQIGTGFKLKLNKYYLTLFTDYVSSSLSFNNASGWDWSDKPFEDKFQKQISNISLTVGLGYFF